jgi:hypothetical protein
MNRKWTFAALGAGILAIAGVVTAMGAALDTIDQHRPWADREHLILVAEDSYAFQIRLAGEALRSIELAIDVCIAQQNCPQETMVRLIGQAEEKKAEIERLKRQAGKVK